MRSVCVISPIGATIKVAENLETELEPTFFETKVREV